MNHTTAYALAACVAIAPLLGSCQNQPSPIQAAVMAERVNGNGFALEMVYETADPLIIAHVQETQELRDPQNVLIRTFTLDYWEWFTLGLLPGQGNIPQAKWQNIQQFQGRQVVLSDAVQTGPGLVAGNVNAPGFRVSITRTHTLYTGGTLQNRGAGSAMDLGSFGFLDADVNGTRPSSSLTQGGQSVDMTARWRQGKTVQGSIQNVGTQQLVLTFAHRGVWQRPPQQNNYGVDWTFTKTIGTAQPVTTQGADNHARPGMP